MSTLVRRLVSAVGSDLRSALRALCSSPRFAIFAVSLMAAGVAVGIGLFSIVYALLYRPLPVHEPESLVFLRASGIQRGGFIPYDDYEFIRDANQIFSGMAARQYDMARIRTKTSAEPTVGEMVSGSYFDVLGISAALGRTIVPSDDHTAADPVVVISHALWRSEFNEDGSVLGRQVVLEASLGGLSSRRGTRYTIVGVMGPEFRGTISPWMAADYWVPVLRRAADYECQHPGFLETGFEAVARLRRGITVGEAQSTVTALETLLRGYGEGATGRSIQVTSVPGAGRAVNQAGWLLPQRIALAVSGVTSVVVAIALANLVGLVLGRMVSRRHQIAVKLALGASRPRVVRELLVEGSILSVVGTSVGLLVAPMLTYVVVSGVPPHSGNSYNSAFSLDTSLDPPVGVLASCLFVGVWLSAVGLSALFGVRSVRCTDLTATVSSTPQGVGSKLRWMVILPQIGIAVMLLTLAGGFLRIVIDQERHGLGFVSEGLAVLEVELPFPARCERKAGDSALLLRERSAFVTQSIDRIAALQPVRVVGIATATPFQRNTAQIAVMGNDGRIEQHYWAQHADVSTNYFEAMGMAVLTGRGFVEGDSGAGVVIVGDVLARLVSGDQSPVGRYVAFHAPGGPTPPKWLEIVGVVKEVADVSDGGRGEPRLYVPLAPSSIGFARHLVVRGIADGGTLARISKTAVLGASPHAVVRSAKGAEQIVAELRYPIRTAAWILTVAGFLGCCLAGLGLYAIMSSVVAQRTREIGIRMALGAVKRDVADVVAREAAAVSLGGTVIGLGSGIAVAAILSNRGLPIPPPPPAAWIAATVAVWAILMCASMPAILKAIRTDPSYVLKVD